MTPRDASGFPPPRGTAPSAMSEEERLLREILALQREMAQELKAIRAELARSERAAIAAPPAEAGDGVEPLIQALAGRNRSAMRAAETLTPPSRRKP